MYAEAKHLVMTVLESGRDARGGAGFVLVSPRKTLGLLALERGPRALWVHSLKYLSLCSTAQALGESALGASSCFVARET